MDVLSPISTPKKRYTNLLSKRGLLQCILIFSLGLFAYFLFSRKPISQPLTVSTDRFLIIYEAGSSHTSAFVFTWKEPFTDFREYVASKSVEPGLSSFANNPSGVSEYFKFVYPALLMNIFAVLHLGHFTILSTR